MELNIFKIAIFLLCSVFPITTAFAETAGCISCHKPHFTEKATCINCHRGRSDTLRKDLAHHLLIPGRYLEITSETKLKAESIVTKQGCRRCHFVVGRGNRITINLDDAIKRRELKRMKSALEKTPPLSMPTFKMTQEESDLVLAYLISYSLNSNSVGSNPVTVKFLNANHKSNIFNLKCGACHKLLAKSFGALGTGGNAPNLSGLFTSFYPSEKPWHQERLSNWLNNPRKIRPNSKMVPINLTEKEFASLIAIINDSK